MEKDIDSLILEQLKKNAGYVSGEELAAKFDISRQALWKHIAKLGDKGYEIAATPHRGYKLVFVPDKFYPWEVKYGLNTKYIGKTVYYYDSVDSTQDLAWDLGVQGSPEGTAVFAETQKKGRGRIGRRWISAKGGIYFSLLLRPVTFLVQEISQITIILGLACIYGIKKATGVECEVKWPNDIFIGDKKLGGILCEMNAETDRVNFVVAGIGINVNTRDLPAEATSLFLYLRKKTSRVELAKRILEEIEVCYRRAQQEGFSLLIKEWSGFCFLWGKRIKVKILDKEIEGEAVGIDESGYLLLRQDTEFIKKISAGEVTRVSPFQM